MLATLYEYYIMAWLHTYYVWPCSNLSNYTGDVFTVLPGKCGQF